MLSLELPDFQHAIAQTPVHPSDLGSFFAATASRNTSENPTRRLPEFHQRKTSVVCTSNYLFGDEEVTFEYIAHTNAFETFPLSLEELQSREGHKFGTKDRDDSSFWAELRDFFSNGRYPARLLTDKERLRFKKRSRRFFLQDRRLWLAPRTNSDRLPQLVIEEAGKRQELLATAHNEIGHRGRDAVY
ncbi:hypothetical protein GGU10DRAFT_280381, partial [Lentinula aff. detonsa]